MFSSTLIANPGLKAQEGNRSIVNNREGKIPTRCKSCSGKLILEEKAETVARYEIVDDGSYDSCPIERCEDFIFEVLCEHDCNETGYKFDRYAGRAVEVQK